MLLEKNIIALITEAHLFEFFIVILHIYQVNEY